MKIVYNKLKNETAFIPDKKLPMDKDPVFLAKLRREIIEEHNRRVPERLAKLNKKS